MSLLANQRARRSTEIVDASIQFCRAHALPLLAIAAVVTIPTSIAGIFAGPIAEFLITLAQNLLFALGGAAASQYIAAVMTTGPIGLGDSFGRVKFGRVIVAQISFNIAVGLSTILLVIPGIIVATRLSLASTVAALEDGDGDKAIRRSWALTRGHAMHVFATLFLAIALSVVVFLGGAFVIGMVGGALSLPDVVTEILIVPLMMIVGTFLWTVFTMLYIDVTVRVEGADIEAMVAELPMAPTGTPVH